MKNFDYLFLLFSLILRLTVKLARVHACLCLASLPTPKLQGLLAPALVQQIYALR